MKLLKMRIVLTLSINAARTALAADEPTRHANAWQQGDSWWNSIDYADFQHKGIAQQLPLVKVRDNQFVNDQGEAVVFRGVHIADTDKPEKEGHFTHRHFEAIKAWGANVVRIPDHPSAWRQPGKKDLKSDLYQAPNYYTNKAETFDFFRLASQRYNGIHSVAIYEIFNEPTGFNGRLGVLTWPEWKALNEEAITIIHAHNPDAITLVAGFNWAYDLTSVAADPIARDNVAYVTHPYPMKVGPPFETHWEHDWGFVADRYPVIATEIGYELATDKGAHVPAIDDGSYGPRITDDMASKGISWVSWVFDPDWAPQMIQDWSYAPTMQGKHFAM